MKDFMKKIHNISKVRDPAILDVIDTSIQKYNNIADIESSSSAIVRLDNKKRSLIELKDGLT